MRDREREKVPQMRGKRKEEIKIKGVMLFILDWKSERDGRKRRKNGGAAGGIDREARIPCITPGLLVSSPV